MAPRASASTTRTARCTTSIPTRSTRAPSSSPAPRSRGSWDRASTAAKMLHPQRVQDLLQAAAAKAMDVARDAKPLKPKARNEIELAFLTSAMADMAELLPGSRRSGTRSVTYASRDYLELYKALLAM